MKEEEVQEKIRLMQEKQQTMQSLLMQKQKINLSKNEYDNALKELKTLKADDKSYQIIGSVMVKKDSAKLITEIEDKVNIANLRLKTLGTQIDKITEESKELQKVISKHMKNQ